MKPLRKPLYFDYNASTPMDPRVLEAMLPYFVDKFGNPESAHHAYGWEAKNAVEKARAQVAELLGAVNNEIIFTSGATESLNLAVLGFLETQAPGRHLITSVAEHKATLETFSKVQEMGHEVTFLPVNRFGQVELSSLQEAIRPNTVLVSLMHANNEVGSINPITEIGTWLKSRGEIVFHVDAAQTAGKHEIDVKKMGIDLLSISAHKFYGPKGIGALFLRRPAIRLNPLLKGGGQERGLRGGTLNVPGIVGLGTACEIAREELPMEFHRLTALRDHLIRSVLSLSLPGESAGEIELNGHPRERLCTNAHFNFHVGLDHLMRGLPDIAFSTASACSTDGSSHVLKSMGQRSDDPLLCSARFSIGRFTTDDDVEELIAKLRLLLKNPVVSGT